MAVLMAAWSVASLVLISVVSRVARLVGGTVLPTAVMLVALRDETKVCAWVEMMGGRLVARRVFLKAAMMARWRVVESAGAKARMLAVEMVVS